PIAIEDVLRQEEGLVLWLDSATLFHGTLAPIFERIARDGVFTLVGQSALTCWCHPDTLRWLPLAIDPMARVYHAAYKRLDRIVLGARQPQLMSSRIGPRADPRQRSSP
ncbi:MAG: hypothetical protein HY047_13100, partial [Acidobacteria bacterium]|nr:hypothetical protein [Acidobacteriota bacterium]